MNIKYPGSYYGVTSFDSILNSNKKENKYAAIYNAGSETSQLSALSSAINTLKSNAAGSYNLKEKDSLNAQVDKITNAMKNSFTLAQTADTFSKPDKRSLHEMASDDADKLMEAYKKSKSFDKLI